MITELQTMDKFVALATNFTSSYYHWTMPWNKGRDGVIAPDFIIETEWGCDTDHMVEKWKSCQSACDNYGWLIKFYCELDGNNRVRLCEYLTNRYSDGMMSEKTIQSLAKE